MVKVCGNADSSSPLFLPKENKIDAPRLSQQLSLPFLCPEEQNRDWAQIDGPVQVSLQCSAAYRKPQLFIEHIRRCALKQRGKTAQRHHTQHGAL